MEVCVPIQSPSRRSNEPVLNALLTANVFRSISFIFFEDLSGNTRVPPPGDILHVGIPPRATLVPIPVRPVLTQVPVPATVCINSVGDKVIFLIRQYELSAT
jgi:hypothetical protein